MGRTRQGGQGRDWTGGERRREEEMVWEDMGGENIGGEYNRDWKDNQDWEDNRDGEDRGEKDSDRGTDEEEENGGKGGVDREG